MRSRRHQERFSARPVWLAVRRKRVLIAFVLVGIVVVTAASIGISKMLESAIRDTALDGAESTASIFTDVVFADASVRDGRFPPAVYDELRRGVASSDSIENVRLWDGAGRIRFASMPLPDPDPPPSDDVIAAQGGAVSSEVTTAGDEAADGELSAAESEEKLLEVYVPAGPPDARSQHVLELYMSYAPVAETIDTANRDVRLVVAAAGLAYFLLLMPQLIRISRGLERIPGRDPSLERRVTAALAAGQIVPHYQPIIDLDDGGVAAVEALARWHHPDRGIVAPDDFLPGIANGDVMEHLTFTMLERTLMDAATWERGGHPLLVSVNVSPRIIFSDRFPERVRESLERAGAPPGLLTLEVTEDLITERPERAQARVAEFDAMGVVVSIDDFGTRDASLTRLASLGAGEMKIDRSFVTGLAHSPSNRVVTRTVCELGETLGMRVVAEGVETVSDLHELVAVHCRLAQGFLFGRPMSAADLEEWLRDWEERGRAQLLEQVRGVFGRSPGPG